jgi:hypothetical protein
MGYSFCVADNPYDQVAFRLSQVPPEMHCKLSESVPSHWRSETWDLQESVFYIRGSFHYTSGYSNVYGIPALDCLRGIPSELAHSVYAIISVNDKNLFSPKGIEHETKLWASTVDALLQQAEARLLAITRWNSGLPKSPLAATDSAALINRQGQVKILEEVISELSICVAPLRRGDVSIEELFKREQAYSR